MNFVASFGKLSQMNQPTDFSAKVQAVLKTQTNPKPNITHWVGFFFKNGFFQSFMYSVVG